MVANAKLPDALRLSGLRNLCNLLKLPVFVGRIRRSRRIRHEQRARCQQYEPPEKAASSLQLTLSVNVALRDPYVFPALPQLLVYSATRSR